MQLFYSHNLNPRVAVAVARHLHSPVEYVRASPRHPDHAAAFRALNPNGQVPVLVEGGHTLWETDAIACRLSRIAGSNFWRTGAAQAEMIQWISWATHHLNAAASVLYWHKIIVPRFSDQVPDPKVIDGALDKFRTHAAILDARLDRRTWLVGDKVSYADFRAATALPFAQGAGLPVAEFPNIARWHDRLATLDAWRAPFDGLD